MKQTLRATEQRVIVDVAGVCMDVADAYIGVASPQRTQAAIQGRRLTVTTLRPPADMDPAKLDESVAAARQAAQDAFHSACAMADAGCDCGYDDNLDALNAAISSLKSDGFEVEYQPGPDEHAELDAYGGPAEYVGAGGAVKSAADL